MASCKAVPSSDLGSASQWRPSTDLQIKMHVSTMNKLKFLHSFDSLILIKPVQPFHFQTDLICATVPLKESHQTTYINRSEISMGFEGLDNYKVADIKKNFSPRFLGAFKFNY